jgi:hypothetical protein
MEGTKWPQRVDATSILRAVSSAAFAGAFNRVSTRRQGAIFTSLSPGGVEGCWASALTTGSITTNAIKNRFNRFCIVFLSLSVRSQLYEKRELDFSLSVDAHHHSFLPRAPLSGGCGTGRRSFLS